MQHEIKQCMLFIMLLCTCEWLLLMGSTRAFPVNPLAHLQGSVHKVCLLVIMMLQHSELVESSGCLFTIKPHLFVTIPSLQLYRKSATLCVKRNYSHLISIIRTAEFSYSLQINFYICIFLRYPPSKSSGCRTVHTTHAVVSHRDFWSRFHTTWLTGDRRSHARRPFTGRNHKNTVDDVALQQERAHEEPVSTRL